MPLTMIGWVAVIYEGLSLLLQKNGSVSGVANFKVAGKIQFDFLLAVFVNIASSVLKVGIRGGQDGFPSPNAAKLHQR
jgi:hypothetical protein